MDYTRTPAVTRYYLSSGLNEVAEYNESGQRVRYYVHGGTYIDERVIMHDDVTDKDYVYLLKDLYTVAGLADERGWPVERYDYDAYGQVQMSRCAVLPYAADFNGDGDVDDDDLAILKQCYKGSGNEPNSYGGLGWIADLDGDGDVDGSDYVQFVYAYNGSGKPPRGAATPSVSLGSMAASRVGNSYFFTGRRLDVLDVSDNGTPHRFTDDVAGLTIYDFRARKMDPVLGRFLQRDPFEYVDGMGLYEYVRGNPVKWVDPLGLFGADVHFDDTFRSLLDAGFDPGVAQLIAQTNLGLDRFAHEALPNVISSYVTFGLANLLPGHQEDYNYHFPGAGPVIPFVPQRPVKPGLAFNDEVFNLLMRILDKNDPKGCNPKEFGKFLHMLQDSWSHRGLPHFGGHPQDLPLWDKKGRPAVSEGFWDTSVDDRTLNRSAHERAMQDTEFAIQLFKAACPCAASGGGKD